ncbi:MAG: site-specific DNA-methyltransferase [Candidatus Paceibacterota bacterium]|jgi:adenine-specific DNA-methyltransferase
MVKRDFQNWPKPELVKELKKLEKRKKYGIVWEDKPEEVAELCKTKLPILEEAKSKEIKTDEKKPVNIMIEGDNYHALSVLNYTHKGKVDVIYIDPPYNTGNNDFIYNDKFVDREDSFRHSKWLSFMEKRLKLAKNLLKSAGAIFISIDDNEQAPLKMLCDEIFGQNNFIANIVVQSNPRGSQSSKHLAEVHEYVMAYAKLEDKFKIKGLTKSEENILEYSYTDSRGKKYRLLGLRQRGGEWRREQRPKMFYPFYVNPKDNSVSLEKTKYHTIESLPKRPTGEEGRWGWSKETARKNLSLLVGKKVSRKGTTDFYDIFRIDYLFDDEGNEVLSKPKTIWIEKELNYQNGRNEIKDIFGKDIFDYPKPSFLIRKIIEMTGNKNSLVLDFFAGSGTTGHAVLGLNKDDGGLRKFILCTDNENNICTDICYPRIKRVISGYKNQRGEEIEGISENLKYYKTDKTTFVDAEPTDENKEKMVAKSTEMLCLKEGCFDEVKKGKDFKIFNNQGKYLGIIYADEGIAPFQEAIRKLNKKASVYVFSLDESAREDEFKAVADLVELKPIPAVILNVYKRIFI